MMAFLRAHGMDPGPLQRPLLAGGITGLAAVLPAAAVFAAFGSFLVAADQVMRLPRPATALILIAALTLAGVLYGLVFRRAANDRRGGWLFGAAFGFVLWMAAPVIVLPLFGTGMMAAGSAATGFLAGFLLWGATVGALFPYVHQPLQTDLRRESQCPRRLGPSAAAGFASRTLRRLPRR